MKHNSGVNVGKDIFFDKTKNHFPKLDKNKEEEGERNTKITKDKFGKQQKTGFKKIVNRLPKIT